jgi:hypothetical protein
MSKSSKPTSVDEQIKEIHYESISRFKEAGYLEQGNTDDVVAKINRLVVEAELKGFNIAFDSHDYDRLRAYREQLTKELGDSNE